MSVVRPPSERKLRESEEDIRRVDQAMSEMSPPPGGGTRTSVEIYEVAVDEEVG